MAFLFITLSSNAQVDPVTGNLINSGTSATDTTSTWINGVYVNQVCFGAGGAGNCGPNPSVRPGGNINFSYGQVDLNQVVNINRALAAGGNGVQLSGFNFGFTAKNGNGWDNGQQDYLAAYVKLYGSSGLMANYDYSAQTNRKYNWTNFNFSETFASPVAASNYTNAQVGFVGRDNNFWAGNYGPEIYNVSFSLKYRVDPCAQNAAYSPTCSGFNAISTGSNVFNSNVWANAISQSVAINTALKNGGIGATVHGFNYGFDYTVGQSWSGCTATNQDGSCSWYMNIPAQAGATAQLTNSNNQSLFSKNHTLTGDGTSGSVSGQYLLPSSLNQTSLGNVRLYGSTSGTGSSIGNFSASLIYTADPCVTNPLYNASCNGYAVAFAKNMLLGSTVASASGAIVSSGGTSMSATGQVDQSQGNTQPEQTQQTQQSQQQGQQTQQQSGPSPTQDPGQTVAQSDPAQPSPTQAGPASTSPQPAGGPQSSPQQQQGGSSSGPSSLAMSVLKTSQDKDKATQQMAVQSAAKALESAVQSSQASSNAAISMNQDMSAGGAQAAVAFASQSTQASMQAIVQSTQPQFTNQVASLQVQSSRVTQTIQQIQNGVVDTTTSSVALQTPTQAAIETQVQVNTGMGITINRSNGMGFNLYNVASNTNQGIQQPTSTFQFRNESKGIDIDTLPVQVASFSGSKVGNPLSDLIMQQRFELLQGNVEQQSSGVNRNVLPNELAGSIDLASMALQPKGFEAYSVVLKDTAFYEPKEVYRGQTVIDNARALRQLGSDRLHKEMVDQQYK